MRIHYVITSLESGGAEFIIPDIAKVIRTAARQADSAAQAGEVSIATTLPADLPKLRGDERRKEGEETNSQREKRRRDPTIPPAPFNRVRNRGGTSADTKR